MEAVTKLAGKLASGGSVVTAEFVPPKSGDASSVKRFAAEVGAKIDAAVVADNCGEITASALACASILAAAGVEPVLTMVTRDRNRIALQSDALGAAMLGAGNVLCLSGDHQWLGASPEAAGAYDIDSVQLVRTLAAMRDEGSLLGGSALDSAPGLFVGAAAHPNVQPLELAVIGLRKKIEAGARFLITDPVTDVDAFSTWMDAVRSEGLHERAAIVASVKATDDAVSAAADTIAKLKAMPGVRGIHVTNCGGSSAVSEVIARSGLARS